MTDVLIQIVVNTRNVHFWYSFVPSHTITPIGIICLVYDNIDLTSQRAQLRFKF